MRLVRISSGSSSFTIILYNNSILTLPMFYFKENNKIQTEIVRVQPKQNLSHEYKELIKLKQAKDKLISTYKKEQEELNRKQETIRRKEEELQRCLEQSKEHLLKLEVAELRKYCMEHPEIKQDAKYRISHYILGFYRQLEFNRMGGFGSAKIYQKMKFKIRNRATKKYLHLEVMKIQKMEKIEYRGMKFMLTIKEIEEDLLDVSLYSYVKISSQEQQFNLKAIAKANEIYYNSVPPIYNLYIDQQKKELCLLWDYIGRNQPLWFRIIKFCSRLKTRKKIKNYFYIKKRLVTIFYQNQIDKYEPIKPLWILVTVNRDNLLTLESFSQGEYILITHQFSPEVANMRQEVTTFLSEHSISYKQNKLLRKLDYEKIKTNVVKIQSKFRSHTQSKRFRNSGHRAQVRLVSSQDRRSFVSCIFGGSYETVYFEGYNKSTIYYQFDKRYSPLLHKAMKELSPHSINSLEQFQTFIGQIESRIKLFEENSQAVFKNMPFEFFERLRRFFFKIKIRSALKRKQYRVAKIYLPASVMVLILFSAPVTLGFYQAHFYQLHPMKRPRRQHSFLISKYLYGESIAPEKIPKMFYISDNLCVVSPPKVKGRHYIIWLKELLIKNEDTIVYNIYMERKVFYAQVYFVRMGDPLIEVDCKELTRKDLMEMTQFEIEAEISTIYRTKRSDFVRLANSDSHD